MSNHSPEGDLLRNSALFREFHAEREEILRHKWFQSEKAGYDVGFDRALLDWTMCHRAAWRASRHCGISRPHALL
jgi:hypothetical protein